MQSWQLLSGQCLQVLSWYPLSRHKATYYFLPVRVIGLEVIGAEGRLMLVPLIVGIQRQ